MTILHTGKPVSAESEKYLSKAEVNLTTNTLDLTYINPYTKEITVDSQYLPVDNFVSEAGVVINPQGQPAGRYLRIAFTNSEIDVVFIPTTDIGRLYESGDEFIKIVENKISVDLSSKLNKITNSNKIYGTDGTGGQTGYSLSQSSDTNSLAQRTSDGTVRVNQGTDNKDAVNVEQLNSKFGIATTNALGLVKSSSIGGEISVNSTTGIMSMANATSSASGKMSAGDKTKLDGITSGAKANVQSDWSESVTTSDSFINNKPNLLAIGTTSSTAHRGDHGNTAYNHSIISGSDPHSIPNASSSTDGKMSKGDKSKLNSIEDSANNFKYEVLTQESYDLLATKDPTKIYFIKGD